VDHYFDTPGVDARGLEAAAKAAEIALPPLNISDVDQVSERV
jgi:hypothetical protein